MPESWRLDGVRSARQPYFAFHRGTFRSGVSRPVCSTLLVLILLVVPGHSGFYLIEAYILALGQENFANQPAVRPLTLAVKRSRLSRKQFGEMLSGFSS